MLTRALSGAWGIVSFTIMALLVMGILILLELPSEVIWGGGVFVGVLFLLRVLSVFRGSSQRSGKFSTFEHNSLGEPITEEFQPPYHSPLPVDATETVLIWIAPIMPVASGWLGIFKGGSRGFFGKGKTTNAENALILTPRRLLFLMIGPETLQHYCPSSKVTDLLAALPGDAPAKRRMLWRVGAHEIHDATSKLLSIKDIMDIERTHYSFTIPLNHITAVSNFPDRLALKFHIDQLSLQYCLKTREELGSLMQELVNLGLSSDLLCQPGHQ